MAAIEAKSPRWARTRKLDDEQIMALRRRVDSLTIGWTTEELAREYGITTRQVLLIARRQKWPERRYEPEQRWWRQKEIEEMLEE